MVAKLRNIFHRVRQRPNDRGVTLYLHFPCFDGVISAVLASEFLEDQGSKVTQIFPVGYDQRNSWLGNPLRQPCAVVDFLYHPKAMFWADHHLSTFLTQAAEEDFRLRSSARSLFYDSTVGSCARVIWEHLREHLERKRPDFQEMVFWADRIDSAAYSDVQEAILGNSPAQQISFSLMRHSNEEYCRFLLRSLRKSSLEVTAAKSAVRNRYREVRSLIEAGLKRFADHARLEDGEVVVSDVESRPDDIVSRYASFLLYPSARYSIAVQRLGDNLKITAMRNPWKSFESIPLGTVFEQFGGGGHQRVGAVLLAKDQAVDVPTIVHSLLAAMREQDLALPKRLAGSRT